MSCKTHTGDSDAMATELGGVNVAPPQKLMITYKYLHLTPDRQFVSIVAKTKWEDLSASGDANAEDEWSDWVWSCLSPDNPELLNYRGLGAVLVTLQVWGRVVVGDNGVVQSQYARIIGYDSDDYYCALFVQNQIPFTELIEIVSNKHKALKVALDADHRFTAEQITEYLSKFPDPELAYRFGQQHNLDICRKIACQDPYSAYRYAEVIDRQPRDDTRELACKDSYCAYLYARDVDRQPRDDTREAACKDPCYAYLYAIDVDHRQPHDDTREAACKKPEYAYRYAVDVDHQYHPLTYQSVKRDPYWLRKYKQAFREQIPKGRPKRKKT